MLGVSATPWYMLHPGSIRRLMRAQLFPGSNNSIFDRILWGSGITIYQEGIDVVAYSPYSQEGNMRIPIEGVGPDVLTAIEDLAAKWRLPDGQSGHLSAISLE